MTHTDTRSASPLSVVSAPSFTAGLRVLVLLVALSRAAKEHYGSLAMKAIVLLQSIKTNVLCPNVPCHTEPSVSRRQTNGPSSSA